MKTKESIAYWLRKIADWLCPEVKEKYFEQVDNYKAKKIGLNLIITKKEIKEARYAEPTNVLSLSEAKKQAMAKAKALVRLAIYNAIKKERLVNYTIKKVGDDISVVGELYLYVKEDEKD